MARSFNGTFNHIRIIDDAVFSFPDGDWSMGGWVYSNKDIVDLFQAIYSHGVRAEASSLYLTLSSTGNSLAIMVSDNDVRKNIGFPKDPFLVPDTWYHIVMRNIGDNTQMYIDGIQSGDTLTDA